MVSGFSGPGGINWRKVLLMDHFHNFRIKKIPC